MIYSRYLHFIIRDKWTMEDRDLHEETSFVNASIKNTHSVIRLILFRAEFFFNLLEYFFHIHHLT